MNICIRILLLLVIAKLNRNQVSSTNSWCLYLCPIVIKFRVMWHSLWILKLWKWTRYANKCWTTGSLWVRRAEAFCNVCAINIYTMANLKLLNILKLGGKCPKILIVSSYKSVQVNSNTSSKWTTGYSDLPREPQVILIFQEWWSSWYGAKWQPPFGGILDLVRKFASSYHLPHNMLIDLVLIKVISHSYCIQSTSKSPRTCQHY